MRRRKKAQRTVAQATQTPTITVPVFFKVLAIHVPDDGHSVTGRRYAGYLGEVQRRQTNSEPQDRATITLDRMVNRYVNGFPRIDGNKLKLIDFDPILARTFEVPDIDHLLIGTVHEVDGQLWYSPA